MDAPYQILTNPVQQATLRAADPAKLATVTGAYYAGCRPKARRDADGTWTMPVYATEDALHALDTPGVVVEGGDIVQRQPEPHEPVPAGGLLPFPIHGFPPLFPARYLTVSEVEEQLSALHQRYPAVTELFALPHTTYEGHTSHALRIGSTAPDADGVYFTACVHAREWGGAEITLAFASTLLAAYQNGSAISFPGEFSVSNDDVHNMVENLVIIIFPCVNPDGRSYDQASFAAGTATDGEPPGYWRQNRRPLGDGNIGVDINRNHNWMWDFRKYFSPLAYGADAVTASACASDDPADRELYHGPYADSEAETRNMHAVFDRYPNIAWYMDIHSFDGDVLYSWSDDTDQSYDPDQNFLNPQYDYQRGVSDQFSTVPYGEFIDADDKLVEQQTAQLIAAAMNSVSPNNPIGPNNSGADQYTAKQSCNLWGGPQVDANEVSYPCSGTVDDWAAARHITTPGAGTVHSFVVEFNFKDVPDPEGNPFHPSWSVLHYINIPQVAAGMLELCLTAAPSTGSGGGGGHGTTLQVCQELAMKIGSLEKAIADLQSEHKDVAALEHQLATLSATYQKQCAGKISVTPAGGTPTGRAELDEHRQRRSESGAVH